jgi:hypothetical protein
VASNNAIGTGAVIITANADGLGSGLDSAGKKVEQWAKKTSAKTGEHVAGKEGGLIHRLLEPIKDKSNELAGQAPGGGLLGTILGAAKAHPVITAALAGLAAVAISVHSVVDSIKELSAVGRTAGSLGVDSAQYMGIAEGLKRVGIDGEAVPAVLSRVGKAAAEGSPALAALGLNAAELLQLPLDEQLMSVAEAISHLPKGAQQASAAMQIFGRSGFQLLPFLQKGKEGIQEFIDHEKKLGVALSQSDMDAVTRAKAALPKIGAVFEGFWNKIVVAAAPVIEFIANKLTAALEAVSPVLSAIANFIDGAFMAAAAIIEEVVSAVGDFIGSMFEGIDTTITWKDIIKTAGHVGIDMFGALAVAGAACWDAIKAGAGSAAIAIGFIGRNLGIGAGGDIEAWGKKQVDAFGKNIDTALAWVDKLHQKLDQKEKDREKKGGGFVPPEFVPDVSPSKFAAAIQAGSQEAWKVSAQAQFGFDTGAADALGVAKKQLDESKKQTGILNKIADAPSGGGADFGDAI